MPTDTTLANQIVFIDGSLQNIDEILAGLAPGISAVVLDPTQDGLTQIAAALAGVTDLSAIHIISHGSVGALQLGSAMVSGDNLTQYQAQLEAIGAALSPIGDLMLYGCDVALGDVGQGFIENLAALTGADVAASTDLTGAAFLNGDWVLEASTGSIETQAIVVDGFNATLGTYIGTAGNDNITGSISADSMSGLGGNDTLSGGAGIDTISGGTGDDYLLGGTENDNLSGNSGNDILDGGSGIDTMAGGTDNDTYYVDTGSDVVVENAGEGNDWIYNSTSFSYSIYSYFEVENLWLSGGSTVSSYFGYGNENNNALHGNTDSVALVDNYFYGYGGNDSLYGYGGNDSLYGAAGDDFLTGHNNDDYLDGGTENDYLDGGAGNDTLFGGSGIDSMHGGAGDDSIYVDSLSDIVSDTSGTDTILSSITWTIGSSFENLTLTGGSSINATGNTLNNILTGNGAANVLDGGTGADTMDGGGGNDTYWVDNAGDATGETDTLTGGIDTVNASVSHTIGAGIENLILTGASGINGTGNSNANTITGNTGDNTLQGLAGNDTLIGNAGDDTLNGGADIDSMVGGIGNDFYYVDTLSDVIVENADEGNDWVYATIDYTLATNFEYLQLGSGTTGQGNAYNNFIYGNSFVNNLYGHDGNDYIYAYGGNDYVDGGSGNDTLYGAEGNDTLYGGIGDDTLDGGTGADNMNAGDYSDTYYVDDIGDIAAESYNDALGGVDTVNASVTHTLGNGIEHLVMLGSAAISGTGNANANQMTGNSGANQLFGLAGADTLNGGGAGSGIDSLYGGADNDIYQIDDATDLIFENLGEGTDQVNSSVNYTLAANVENLVLTGSAISGSGNTLANVITGNSGNNSLTGGDGDDTLTGGAGIDTLSGGIGNDVFVVDSTTDTITESSGTDRIESSVTFNLSALSAIENLTLTGIANIDATGNAGANTLVGNTGNNRLDGGSVGGNDTMIGGIGNDTYVVDAAGDVVTEFSDAGTDTIETSISVGLLASNVENATLTGGAVSAFGNAQNNILTGNSLNNVLDGGAGNDTLIGLGGDDTYYVDSSSDVVTEGFGAGFDTVVSSVANYTLSANVETLTLTGNEDINGTGNSGANLITGNSGDNVLATGGGNDTLDGGLGTDDVAYLGGVVGDWSAPVLSGAEATITNTGTGQVVTLQRVEWLRFDSGPDVAVVMGQNLTGTSFNDTISGGAGNDTINGGAGADSMTGSAGDDIYWVDNAGDTVVEVASEGSDWVYLLGDFDYILPTHVENLQIFGSADLDGTGNELDNTIYGNGGNNVLSGLGGNDYLWASFGNDTLLGGSGNDVLDAAFDGVADVLDGGDGDDTYYLDGLDTASDSGDGYDTAYVWGNVTLGEGIERFYLFDGSNATGNSGANEIHGNSLDNFIDGAGGADTMFGESGSDTYVVDNSGDLVIENFGGGYDGIQSSVSFVLPDNVELLSLTGSNDLAATGNALDNALNGNSGNNVLDGGAGADNMAGWDGNDSYHVDNVLDVVFELSGAGTGTDTVFSSVTGYVLAANVENLTLQGSDNIDGSGNTGANMITGNSGNNSLAGGGGNDTLKGAEGDDTLDGGDGDDLLSGGSGFNVANYAGNIADYRFGVTAGGAVTLTDLIGSGGTDTFEDIQKVQFADTAVTVGTAGQFGEFGVNAFMPTYNTTPSVAMLAGGGHVVTWENNYQSWFQRHDALGAKVGDPVAVGQYTYDTDIVALADGGFAIAYYGFQPGGGGYAIRSAHYDAGGNLLHSQILQVEGGTPYVYGVDPVIAALEGGGYAVAWSRHDGVTDWDIHAAVVGADGTVITPNFLVSTPTPELAYTSGFQYYPSITATAGGGFAVGWYDGGQTRTRAFDSAGTSLAAELPVGTGGNEPAVVGLADGDLLTLWQSWTGDGYDVFAARYDADPEVESYGSVTTVNDTKSSMQDSASAAATPDGGYVVVWASDGQDGSGYGIYGQRFAANGSKAGEEFRVNGTTLVDQLRPDVAVAPDGDFVVTWRSDAGSGGIFSQRFAADGTRIGGIAVTGGAASETISAAGATQAAVLSGADGDDSLIGGNVADSLTGGAGDDTLVGAGGADSMAGGSGNDVYVVDVTGDSITENDDEGIDEVQTSINNYVLPETSVERLVLTTGAFNGEGNSLSNALVGNMGINFLKGGGGDDTLEGGQNADTARFSGEMSEYVFGVAANGSITVRHTVAEGGEGTDTLSSIQQATFSGGKGVFIDTLGNVDTSSMVTQHYAGESIAAVGLADGGRLLVWAGSNGSINGIFAQKVDAFGDKVGGVQTVTQFASDYYDAIDSELFFVDRGEGYLVAWKQRFDVDGTGPASFEAQRIDGRLIAADGEVLGGAPFNIAPQITAVLDHPAYFYNLDVVGLDAGGFKLAYGQYASDVSSLHESIYAADGSPLSATSPPSLHGKLLGNGGYLDWYLQSEPDPSSPNGSMYWTEVQRYDASGNTVGAAFQLTDKSTSTNGPGQVQVRDLGNGNWFALWNINNGSNMDIFGRAYYLSGDDLLPAAPMDSQINIAGSTAFNQYDETIAVLPDGKFVVAWRTQTTTQADVFARIFLPNGSPSTDVFRVNVTEAGSQLAPAIAVAGDGGFTVFYSEFGARYGVFGQRYDADGNPVGGLELKGDGFGINADLLNAGDAVLPVSIYGLGGNDTLTGGTASDTLDGGGGNDTLDGGAGGNDTLIGGNGNDTFVWTGAGDVLVELKGQGSDTVLSHVSYALLSNSEIENVVLVAGAATALNADGNDKANRLTGNEFANQLDGKAGNDTMVGGTGNDTYIVESILDQAVENADEGIDTLKSSVTITALAANVEILELTGSDSIQGTGNELNNTITGNSAANLLEGRQGDDLYIVDALDTVIEVGGEGTDTIRTGEASYSLASTFAVENLEFSDSAPASGAGNAQANLITGNAGNDTLDGAAGNDTLVGGGGIDSLIGGTGDDVFDVDIGGDVTHELVDEGVDTVRSSVSYTLSGDATTGFVEKLLLTGSDNIDGTGNALDNTITGNSGSNRLDGGAGIDTLVGGAGDDTYVMDATGDSIVELADGGSDTAETATSMTNVVNTVTVKTLLANNVENLLLTGSGNIAGNGNSLDNLITGNSGNNELDGQAGADTLVGGTGNDTYIVDNVGDVVTETAGGGTDTVKTTLADFHLPGDVENLELTGTTSLDATGNEMNNVITGNTLNNLIDGGAGNDTMRGGKGDDTYIVDSLLDKVEESFGQGTDTAIVRVSGYVLPTNVEYLQMENDDPVLRLAPLLGKGNNLSNIIVGNAGDNTLDGGLNDDIMIGGPGNDVYKVDNANDLIIEEADYQDSEGNWIYGGIDRVESTISFDLASNVEDLTLQNIDNITLLGNGDNAATGNELANVLIGNDGNNLLDGRGGNDNMSGGKGNDTYVVEQEGDVVTEVSGEGTDLVRSTLSTYTLVDNFENLTLDVNFDGTTLLAKGITGYGNAAANVITGNGAIADFDGSNLLYGLDGNDSLYGGGGNDSLYGGNDNDSLDGGAGADSMAGGAGNDSYYVDNALDKVDEGVDAAHDTGGNDNVIIDFRDAAAWSGGYSYELPVNVEEALFAFVSLSQISTLVGNALANKLTGNDGSNRLDGGGGKDTMAGGKGDDVYVAGQLDDSIIESGDEGVDTVEALVDGYTLGSNLENLTLLGGAKEGNGNAQSNLITGNATVGNVLNGGGGADTMIGGAGDDTYYADTSLDQIIDTGGGTDHVIATGNYALGDNVENLTLDGFENISGFGNAQNNSITGNNGNNLINGGDGYDKTSYAGAVAGVTVNLATGQASGGGGSDTLLNVEGVIGSGDDDSITGNGAANDLEGGNGADVLDGAFGPDTMTGGAGSDQYWVDDPDDVVEEFDNTPEAGGGGGGGYAGFNLAIYAGVNDTVNAKISYTLPGFLENLVLLGPGDLTGTGNDLLNGMLGNDGNNSLQGMGANDTLIGGIGNDTLDGGTGDDLIEGGAGNDSLEGGTGIDTAVFALARANYTVTRVGAGYTVTANTGTDGVDTLTNVEKLQFSDQTETLAKVKVVNDFNGDGKSDVLLQNTGTGVIFQHQLNGTTVTGGGSVAGPGTDWKVVGSGDYNGDGKSDVLMRSDSLGLIWQYQLNGTAITGGGSVVNPGVDWKVVGDGDYNGDGKDDILLRSDSTGLIWQFQLNGTAVIGGGSVAGPGTDWKVAGSGDYNGDGKSDLLLRSDSTGLIWEYQLNGNAIIGGGSVIAPGTDWKVAGNGDYNGDGKSDILLRSNSTGLIWEYQLNGNAVIGGGSVAGPGTDWKVVGDGDYNGDGKADVLLRSDSTGMIWEYQMNGTVVAGSGAVTSMTTDWIPVG
ncbi:MAG: DUF4347 domain-containing protein [Rhodocyclales bacterium]|nr:DUF4347 domain-containing protein [Rhodocyclales bacterium]